MSREMDVNSIHDKIHEMGNRGLRMLAVAYKRINKNEIKDEMEEKDEFNVRKIEK